MCLIKILPLPMVAFKSFGALETLFNITSTFIELDEHLSNSNPPQFFSLGKVLVIICKNSSFEQVISGFFFLLLGQLQLASPSLQQLKMYAHPWIH